MKIGIVSKWIASGQAIVARQLRSALDDLGHETFVLARPGGGPRAAVQGSAADHSDDVWDQPGVTEASTHEVPYEEYESWASANELDLIMFDENYQFDEVARLRESGVTTLGRFVWESFGEEHVEDAKRAYDEIYSLTRCEVERYEEMEIESQYVQWGIHPELLEVADDAERGYEDLWDDSDVPGLEITRFYFPGSFLGRRKPIRKVIKAFAAARGDGLRLVISGQLPDHRDDFLAKAAERDPRIELMLEDLPEDEHRASVASCDVCLAPSRWEGLGLPLFEATAYGQPIITNDQPPMDEMVHDDRSGILVPSIQNGETKSGLPAWDPDIEALTEAIERLSRSGRARTV